MYVLLLKDYKQCAPGGMVKWFPLILANELIEQGLAIQSEILNG